MNPFRALFLSLSKMPPVLMLFIILGLAVTVTQFVMGFVHEAERRAGVEDPDEQRVVVIAIKQIPAGAEIDMKNVEQREIPKLTLFEDAVHHTENVVGKHAVHRIPARQQVRIVDIE